MDWYAISAIILAISALAAVFNARILKLPDAIGLMGTGVVASFIFLIAGQFFPDALKLICDHVAAFDFSSFVLQFAVGFLVFAGAFTADFKSMRMEQWPILVFATLGILLSTVLVGGMTFGALKLCGLTETPFLHCLLFGALISPTDPIAVLAILKKTSVPESLQADIAGESLLNDGVAVVVFLTILQLVPGGEASHQHAGESGVIPILILFIREVVGGAILGAAFGYIGLQLIKIARLPAVDILVTLALVMGCFSLADKLHVSGVLAMVVTGLILGSVLKSKSFNRSEKRHLEYFWEAIDYILNAVLFTLMGFVILRLSDNFQFNYLVAGIVAIPIVLLARLISVGLPLPFTKLRIGHPKATLAILTWGGLRGGISIALALVLTETQSRDLIIHMTYIVVAFSILVQGITISPLVKKVMPEV